MLGVGWAYGAQQRERPPEKRIGFLGLENPRNGVGLVGVQQGLPDLFAARPGQRERDCFPVRVDQQQQRVADDRLAAFVDFVDEIAGKADAEAVDECRRSRLRRTFRLPRGIEPRNVLDVGAADGAAEEKLRRWNTGCSRQIVDASAHEFQEFLAAIVKVPVQPGQLVVLAIGVVVAVLRVAEFIARDDHGDAFGEEEGGDEISFLPFAQLDNVRIVGRAFAPQFQQWLSFAPSGCFRRWLRCVSGRS